MSSGMRAHILVVDDDPAIRGIVGAMLGHAGFAVVAADGRDQAIDACRTGRFDLAILDVDMPCIRGPELLPMLRQLQAGLPAIFISGLRRAEVDGINGCAFVPKPFTVSALLGAVTTALAS